MGGRWCSWLRISKQSCRSCLSFRSCRRTGFVAGGYGGPCSRASSLLQKKARSGATSAPVGASLLANRETLWVERLQRARLRHPLDDFSRPRSLLQEQPARGKLRTCRSQLAGEPGNPSGSSDCNGRDCGIGLMIFRDQGRSYRSSLLGANSAPVEPACWRTPVAESRGLLAAGQARDRLTQRAENVHADSIRNFVLR